MTQSLWLHNEKADAYPSADSGISVDVIIIGGGMAGLSCAYLLQQRGIKVAVVEAERVGSGVSGFTTAHITSEHNLAYDYLIETLGLEKAQLYADANQHALESIARLVVSENIACDFERVDSQLYCENQDDVEKLQQEFKAARRLGLPVAYEHAAAALPFATHGVIRYRNQAQFHPVRYMTALARLISGYGSCVFEHSRCVEVKEGEPCEVLLENGTVLKAADVIVATHAPILDRGLYFSRMEILRSYVIGVKMKEKISALYDDTADPYHYIRNVLTAEGDIVLIGGEDHATGDAIDTVTGFQKLEVYARGHFTVESIDYRWSSQEAYPFDKVPFIGPYTPLSKHLYVAAGFSGYGMTNSMIAGVLLTDLIRKEVNPWSELYSPARFKVTNEGPGMAKAGVGMVVTELKDKLGRHVSKPPVCTHLGCDLHFNTAEESWDCPCHGSRFSRDGRILNGPAVKPLASS